MPSAKAAVCFVSAQHPAFDKRVFEKEAVSLARAGYDVSHVCPAPTAGRESVRGVDVMTYARGPGTLARLRSLPTLFRLARTVDATAYHCNEPDSWLVGMLMRMLFGKIVVFDCHEHYVSRMRALPPLLRGAAEVMLRLYLQLMGLFTDVIVLAKYSVADDFSWSRGRQVVVLNTTRIESLQRVRERPRAAGEGAERTEFAFVHIGGFMRERGSEQLLQAMRELDRRRRRDYRIVLIGQFLDGSEDDFVAKAEAWSLRDRIEFHRWMPFEDAFDLVCRCHAGLVLFQQEVLNNVYGMPHKMFDYMLAGLPVIAPAFAPDIVRVLRDTEAGLLIDTGDPVQLANTMERLMDDRAAAADIGRRGQEAVFARYNWEADARILLQAYAGAFQRRGIMVPAAALVREH